MILRLPAVELDMPDKTGKGFGHNYQHGEARPDDTGDFAVRRYVYIVCM